MKAQCSICDREISVTGVGELRLHRRYLGVVASPYCPGVPVARHVAPPLGEGSE